MDRSRVELPLASARGARPAPTLWAAPLERILGRARPLTIAGLAVATGSIVFGWFGVVSGLDLREITDVGIVSVLPPAAYGLLALLAATFLVSLRMRPLVQPLLVIQVASLVFMLYGAPVLFEEAPRFITTWLHVGFVDAIAETGRLYPFRDARFDWPAFFVLFAFVQNALGLDSMISLVAWVPVLQTLLYLPPLYLIYRSATGDERMIWLGLFVFVATNWVGQDYFSPQGLNVLLYLTILAILLTWFRRAPSGATRLGRIARWIPLLGSRVPLFVVDPNASVDAGPEAHLSARQQIGLVAIVGVLFGMSIASHQLTPFAMAGGVTLLTVFARLRARSMIIVMVVMLSAWLTFMASTFLSGHLAGLLEEVASPAGFAESNVASRLRGSDGHLLVIQVRLAFTLAVWGLATIGGIRRLVAGRIDLSLALLAAAPFALVLLQGYGGEMVLRVYLFSVPFMAFFVAAALVPTVRRMSWALTCMACLVLVAVSAGFLFARYGNEKADLVTAAEYEAVQYAADLAEPGDTIATVNYSVPLAFRDWQDTRIGSLGAQIDIRDIDRIVGALELVGERSSPYLVITRGNAAFAELNYGIPADEWEGLMTELTEQPELQLVFENRDAKIYHWVDSDGAPE